MITSYSSATGGSGAIVNQIQDAYNGLDQLTQQYQGTLRSREYFQYARGEL